MIVDPDFPDHWKTRMLVELLNGDEAAPVYLLRLWAHCQNRRTAIFEGLPPVALKAICRFSGSVEEFEAALVTSGFIERDGEALIVCGWEEYNASLIANWSNGKKGGRPKKPIPNPEKTHGLSMENPDRTHQEPIREDKSRIDKIGSDQSRSGASNGTSSDSKVSSINAEKIYQAYPKKIGKDKALKAIQKALKSQPPEHLLERTKAYAEAVQWKERQFIPHPSTWFNEGRFDDDPAEWRPPDVGKRKPAELQTADFYL